MGRINRHMSRKMDIGSLFLRDYSSIFSGREIARRTKTSPQAALNIIKELVQDKCLQSKVEGRNKNYSLNLTNLRTKIFLEQVELIPRFEFQR